MAYAIQDSTAKSQRIAIRATSRQCDIIRQAAEASGKSMTSFLLDVGFTEAQRTLADRRLFSLDTQNWNRFVEALDRPVSEKPRLRKLLQTPSVLD